MKKIINITLGGRSISIEETAYEKIKAYTEDLRLYFKNEEGMDEIVSDIEYRFAELMHDKIRKGATHVTDADVDDMIATMGRPEDFDAAAASANIGDEKIGGSTRTNEKRRLYRDERDKILGGVCSGVASWLNIDPTIVRVLFAIVSFGGFGSGILIYLALWIFLPARNMNIYQGKRMYRDPDNKWIGGVAGGMGAYFKISPNTLRLIFLAPLILSMFNGLASGIFDTDFRPFSGLIFGGLFGTFVFIYIVLWIVLPEALSPYQKMEMHGKTIDVNTIKQNVQDSMGDLKSRLQNWGKEVKDSAEKLSSGAGGFAKTRAQQFGQEFNYTYQRNRSGVGQVFGTIFKALFAIIGGIIALSLLAVFLTLVFSGFAWLPVNDYLWTSETQQLLAWGTLIFFVGAPIVGILVWLVRRILNIQTPGNYLNWMFGGLWTIGWVCLMFFLASVSNDFKRYQSIEEPVSIQQPSTSKMIIKVSEPELEYEGNFGWMDSGNEMHGFSVQTNAIKVSTVSLGFEKSGDSLYHVTIYKESLGKTDEDALNRVKKIQYTITSKDSVLDLANGFTIDKASKYRLQNVTVIVKVPVGKKINIDESVKTKLNDIDIDFSERKRHGRNTEFVIKNIHRYRSNTDYTMDSTGNLVSEFDEVDTNGNNDVNYRWDGDENDTLKNAAPEGFRAPAPPSAPAAPGSNEDAYRYDSTTNAKPDDAKEELKKVLEQKQKELDSLKKKLGQ